MIPDPWRKRKKCSPSRRSFQVEQPQAAPKGFSRITSHETRLLCLPTHDFPRFPTISRHFPAPPTPPVKGPRAVRCEIPVMCTKSRFPQENARSAAFAAAPFALGAQPAEVDANGHTAPGSAAKSPLIRVDSCPFVVNEPVLRKGNVLYCIDRLFDKRAPAGSRGFRGERRAGWSVRASSSERKSHVPR